MKNARKLAFGLAVLGASLWAGIGLANAQTGGETPSTTEAPAPAERDGNCPEKDGTGRGAATDGPDATATNAGAFRLARRA